MTEYRKTLLEGQIVDEHTEVSVVQLCKSCAIESELVDRLVAEGIIEPSRQEGDVLYFPQHCVKRTHVVVNLRSELGVNLAGAALALELLDRIEKLKSRLRLVEVVKGIK